MQPQPKTIFTEPDTGQKPPRAFRIVKLPSTVLPRKKQSLKENPEEMAEVPTAVVRKATTEMQEETVKETEKQREKIKNLVRNSQVALYKCSAVFPFDLFPDELSIEPTQVNVSNKLFFFTSHVKSIPIKNIADAIIETAPFFAKLTIIDQSFAENSISIAYLNKKEAETARKIIQGLIVMSKEGVDLTQVDMDVLRKQVTEIGKMQAIKQV